MSGVIVSGDTQSDAMRPFTALVAQMELAWNKADPQNFAACFGEQADFVDMMGGHGVGRAMVEQAHRAMFNGAFAKSRIQYTIDKIKPVVPGRVVVMFLRSRLTVANGTIWCRPTLTLRNAADGWKIAVFQNTRIADTPMAKAPAPAKAGEGDVTAAETEAAPAPEAPVAEAKPAAEKPSRKKK
ncbi:MAG: SgcJ/EcaC family oxidoreductase [Proteobacteria bacterium]|nr:SgcJ/EcaC family oxidoreductase [Pseudomonadota bacterium]